MKCGQLCPYNTISGCKVNWYNGICPLSNTFAQNEREQTNADRMIKMLQENDVYSLLDWWQEIFEDGVPSEDYFKWWLQQPAEVD
jgi:hypothetical protein